MRRALTAIGILRGFDSRRLHVPAQPSRFNGQPPAETSSSSCGASSAGIPLHRRLDGATPRGSAARVYGPRCMRRVLDAEVLALAFDHVRVPVAGFVAG